MKLHLVRHGETDINAAGRLQGCTDSILTKRGQRQADDLALAALAWRPTAVYASPLRRAREVGERIAGLTGAPLRIEPRLTEMNMGELEGITVQEMREGWPDLYAGWRRDASGVTMPGGESLPLVQGRAMAAFDELDAGFADADAVVAVTHNFTIRCIVAAVIGLPLGNINHLELALGSVSMVQTGPRGRRLSSYNAVDHLAPDNRA